MTGIDHVLLKDPYYFVCCLVVVIIKVTNTVFHDLNYVTVSFDGNFPT